jgi:MtfA peptidase
METAFSVITVIIVLFVATMLATHLVSSVIEPFYMLIFQKPVYVHFYASPKKLPDTHRYMLTRFAFYRKLPEKKKAYFEHRVHEFIVKYAFYGKQDLVVTEEMRVMIAATYVKLTFGFRVYLFDVFDKIILYPDSYESTIHNQLHNGEFNPRVKAIVFSWAHFQKGHENDTDNLNLGIHEFAHALHFYGLKKRDNGAALFAHKYERILKEIRYPANRQKLLDSQYFREYAYANHFEFIAVLLEHFFETPQAFKNEFPVLYEHVRIMINYSEK